MNEPSERLLRVARELAAISESALAYCRDPFDIDRFHRVGALARDLMSEVAAEEHGLTLSRPGPGRAELDATEIQAVVEQAVQNRSGMPVRLN